MSQTGETYIRHYYEKLHYTDFCAQRFSHIFQGMFYGLACYRPFLVPVPVNDGISGPPTLDDLLVNYWIKQRAEDDCTATRQHLRQTFARIPHSDVPLDGLYTVFVESPRMGVQRNHVLQRIASLNGSQTNVTHNGSILIVKQALSTDHAMLNMKKNDMALVNFLMSRYVSYFRHSTIRTDTPSSIIYHKMCGPMFNES